MKAKKKKRDSGTIQYDVSLLRKLETLSKYHATEEEAALVLRLPPEFVINLLKTDLPAKRAWKRGRSLGRIELRQRQFKLAETNARMAIHLGRQYLGQSNRPKDPAPVATDMSQPEFNLDHYTVEELEFMERMWARQLEPKKPRPDD